MATSKRRGFFKRRAPRRRTGPRVHHKKQFTLPLAVVLGFLPAIMDVKKNAPNMGWGGSAMHTGAGLIGWDTVGGKWAGWNQMRAAGTPGILLGFAAHWAAGKFGINRMLSRSGIPFIRI